MGLIANISKGTGLGGATAYVMDKPGAERLHVGNMAGRDVESIVRSFGAIRRMRPDIERACFHAALSTDEHLDIHQWEQACERYVDAMGYGESQWFAVRHTDSDHEHVHIVANAIDLELERVNDSNDFYKSQEICAELEQELGLEQAPRERPRGMRSAKHYEWRLEQEGELSIKQDLQARVGSAIDAAVARGGSMKLLVDELDHRSVDMKVRRDSEDIPRGAIFCRRRDGEAMSGSSLARNWSWGKLQSKEGLEYDPGRDDKWLDESTQRAEISMDVGGFGVLDAELEQTADDGWTAPTWRDHSFEAKMQQLAAEREQAERAAEAREQAEIDARRAEWEQANEPPSELEILRLGYYRKLRAKRDKAIKQYIARLKEQARAEREQADAEKSGPMTLQRRVEQLEAMYKRDKDKPLVNEGVLTGRILRSESWGQEKLVVIENDDGWSFVAGPAAMLDCPSGGYLTVDFDDDWYQQVRAVDVLTHHKAAAYEAYLEGKGLERAESGHIDGYVSDIDLVSTREYGHSEEEAEQRALVVVREEGGSRFCLLHLNVEEAGVLEKGGELELDLSGTNAFLRDYTPPPTRSADRRGIMLRAVQAFSGSAKHAYHPVAARTGPRMPAGGGVSISLGGKRLETPEDFLEAGLPVPEPDYGRGR